MIRSPFLTIDYAVKVLSILLIYRICHSECHFNTIVAVYDGCHT